MEIRALTPAEQKYTYAQSMQLEGTDRQYRSSAWRF